MTLKVSAITLSLLLLTSMSHADTLTLCNRTGETIRMAEAFRCCFESPDHWHVAGWNVIADGDCWSGFVPTGFEEYDGFVNDDGEPQIFNVQTSVGRIRFADMCVMKDQKFNLTRGTNANAQLGDGCPPGGRSIPISFGLIGGDNRVTLTMTGSPRPATPRTVLPPKSDSCEALTLDLGRGTLNGELPTLGPEEVKARFPCFTGETYEGADQSFGGGVFFLRHSMFFYTARDFIQVREGFRGTVSPPLLGATVQALNKTLGLPAARLKDPRSNADVALYVRPYGCLAVKNNAGTISELSVSHSGCSKFQADLELASAAGGAK